MAGPLLRRFLAKASTLPLSLMYEISDGRIDLPGIFRRLKALSSPVEPISIAPLGSVH
jgi:hypothetical protein